MRWLACLALGIASAASAAESGDRVLGEWRGTSLCTNLALTPGCKNERVRYVFVQGKKGGYHLVAEKMVGAEYQKMYEMDFSYVEDRWVHDFDSPACTKCRWWYRIEGDRLVGGVTAVSGTPLRKVDATRLP